MRMDRKTWDYLWIEWIKPILIAGILALFIRTFIVQPFKIPSNSMYPTLRPGDRIFVNKFTYGTHLPFTDIVLPEERSPEKGDIIVFTSPIEKKKYLVKRFVAKSGESVLIKNGELFVDGESMNMYPFNRFFYYNRGEYGLDGKKITVPEGHFFVLGDNSANSMDSRYWGFVPDRNLVGKAFIVHWPIGRMQLIKNEG